MSPPLSGNTDCEDWQQRVSLRNEHDMPRALLLENIDPVAVELLRRPATRSRRCEQALDEAELTPRWTACTCSGIRSKTQVTAEVLARRPDLVAIGAFCIGTNQIDLRAAAGRRRGVQRALLEHAQRRRAGHRGDHRADPAADRQGPRHARGVWDKSANGSHEMRGRPLGIVGYGNIGSQLSVLAEALGMRVLFYDTADKLALGNAAALRARWTSCWSESDVVTLHVDGARGNGGSSARSSSRGCARRSIFLNLSRGFVVDDEALREHLAQRPPRRRRGRRVPRGAEGAGDEFVSALRGLPNVILTPHIGGSTEEAQ